jgi:tryptophan synthase alpha chain
MSGPQRIAEAFANTRGRAALMPYLMGGFPTVAESVRIGQAYVDGGADLIELGVPFSDPLADGPVIHAAGTEALRAGTTVADVFDVCRVLGPQVPVVMMLYANLVLSRGVPEFVDDLVEAGAAGLIVPDLPHEEAATVRAACEAAGLALIPLVAPTTRDELLAAIGRDASGFVYAVSLVGTTGERGELPPGLAELVERIRAATNVPVAVGFGISTGEQARAVGELADGVIVGSRVVRAAGEAGPDGVREVVADLAAALSL